MPHFNIESFEERLRAKNSFDGNLLYGAEKFHSQTNRSGPGRPSSGYMVPEHAKVIRDTGKERYERILGIWEEVVCCPVCASKMKEFFLSRMGLDVYKCLQCSLRYLNPRVKFQEASRIYADDRTASDIYTQPLQIEVDRIKYQYGLDLIEQLIEMPSKKDKIMDVGCGAGVFLKVAEENNWRTCVGIDINERYSHIYKESGGIQFINAVFENLEISKLGSGYNCITLWGVLEHIYNFDFILNAFKQLLNKNGLLFVLVPNADSLITKLSREMSPTFNWKHVSHFSPASLKYLMHKYDFEMIFLETVITEIDNIKSYMSGEYPYHGFGDPGHLFDFITPEYIHRNLLGSRLIGIFRNVKP